MNDEDSILEEIVWKDRPSQLINFIWYITLFWTIIIPLIKYLKTRFTIFELTTERVRTKYGVLSQTIDEVELYRVRDYQIKKPFLLRIFGLGHVFLITSDKTHSMIHLKAIRNVEGVTNLIRKNVEITRKRTKTREIDYT